MQMISCIEILCWSFLECINYFLSELVIMFRIFQFVLVLAGKVPLELIYTWVWCLLYKQFWICDLSVQLLLLLNMAYLNQSNKDLKFKCRRVNDFRQNKCFPPSQLCCNCSSDQEIRHMYE